MWHLLLSPFCMTTVILCLQWTASSHASGTRPGGQALAGVPLTEGKMAGGLASSALRPQCRRDKVSPARRGGHKVTTDSPCFEDVAPGSGETISEGNMRLQRTSQAERETTILLDGCCFWNDTVWNFICNLDLLYHDLILPICKVISIFITIVVIIGIQFLTRGMRSPQSWRESTQQSMEWWLGSPLNMVWWVDDHPECAICLQGYEPNQALKLLSCFHAYHGKCIDLWHRAQRRRKTCPLCQRRVTAIALISFGTLKAKQE